MLRGDILGSTLRGGLGLNGIVGGWLREVRANDTNPALDVRQDGTGKLLSLLGGTEGIAEVDKAGTAYWRRVLSDNTQYQVQFVFPATSAASDPTSLRLGRKLPWGGMDEARLEVRHTWPSYALRLAIGGTTMTEMTSPVAVSGVLGVGYSYGDGQGPDAQVSILAAGVASLGLKVQGATNQTASLARLCAPSAWGASGDRNFLECLDTDGGTKLTLIDRFGLLRLRNYASLPTAGADYRSKLAVVEGGAGVLDHLYICRKLANDTYAWTQLTT